MPSAQARRPRSSAPRMLGSCSSLQLELLPKAESDHCNMLALQVLDPLLAVRLSLCVQGCGAGCGGVQNPHLATAPTPAGAPPSHQATAPQYPRAGHAHCTSLSAPPVVGTGVRVLLTERAASCVTTVGVRSAPAPWTTRTPSRPCWPSARPLQHRARTRGEERPLAARGQVARLPPLEASARR